MTLFDLKKVVLAGGFGLVVLAGISTNANAQSRREVERERQRIERENARYERDRQRQSQVDRNNANYSHGYQQGLLAGEYDGRKKKYNQSNVYRDTGSYPNAGDPTSSDYIYRQGYLKGYNDGYNGRRNY